MQAGEHMLWKGSRSTQPDIQINIPTVLTDRCGQKVNRRLPKRLLERTDGAAAVETVDLCWAVTLGLELGIAVLQI